MFEKLENSIKTSIDKIANSRRRVGFASKRNKYMTIGQYSYILPEYIIRAGNRIILENRIGELEESLERNKSLLQRKKEIRKTQKKTSIRIKKILNKIGFKKITYEEIISLKGISDSSHAIKKMEMELKVLRKKHVRMENNKLKIAKKKRVLGVSRGRIIILDFGLKLEGEINKKECEAIGVRAALIENFCKNTFEGFINSVNDNARDFYARGVESTRGYLESAKTHLQNGNLEMARRLFLRIAERNLMCYELVCDPSKSDGLISKFERRISGTDRKIEKEIEKAEKRK